MGDFIILGTDTDVGKTTFGMLWLHRFGDRYEYWKPLETGGSDVAAVAQCVPSAIVHPPARRFLTPVAPPLAARIEEESVPAVTDLAAHRPATTQSGRSLVIETFGGPFSPLTESDLQLALIRAFGDPCLLVSSPALGGIGRTLQCLAALRSEGIYPFAVVLLGPRDPFAEERLHRDCQGLTVVALEAPTEWTSPALRACADTQAAALDAVAAALASPYRAPAGTNAPFRCSRIRQNAGLLEDQPPHSGECGYSGITHTDLVAEDTRCVWHPYTPLLDADEPLPCVGASEEFLELADGRKVIDGISSWWTILHGHRHPPLMLALAKASHKLDHVLFAGVTHPHAVELADLLLGTMPWFGGRVFYSDNGSTAVEVALKMAYQFWCHHGQPRRTRFIGFEHGYHGDTFGAMAVSRDPVFFGRFEPLLLGAEILPLIPARLETYLQDHGAQIAAVILEPLVQGAGGMRMHTPETLKQIVEITQRHGILFIADEVMTGGGRTGTLWAHQAAGVVPDLLCAAKTLTGGILPLAATLAAPKVVDAFRTADRSKTFFHGHSFTANPLACAVAARNYRLLLANPPDAPARMERFWTQALAPLRSHPRVKEVRIRGTIAAVELDVAGGYLADVGRQLRKTCLERDAFLRPLGSVLYAMPPYDTSMTSLTRIADAMIAAVSQCVFV